MGRWLLTVGDEERLSLSPVGASSATPPTSVVHMEWLPGEVYTAWGLREGESL